MAIKKVLVAGDFVLDNHIYHGNRHHLSDQHSLGVQYKSRWGGANLIFEILNSLHVDTKKIKKDVTDEDGNPATVEKTKRTTHYRPFLSKELTEVPGHAPPRSAYAFWRPFPDRSGRKSFWRVSEPMGFGADASPTVESETDLPDAPAVDKEADIVVISEGGMGFRQSNDWTKLPLESAGTILLKSSGPLMKGKLWEKLSAKPVSRKKKSSGYRDKLILVVSVGDLRRTSARINSGLSWDATVKHVVNELQTGNSLEKLTHCRHLIVTFGSEAALWIDFAPDAEASHASFIFDPGVIEGDHARSVEGTAFGFQSCLTAAIANEASRAGNPNFELACEGGLSAMRNLLEQGDGPATEAATGFPAERLAKVIRQPSYRYSRARFDFPIEKLPTTWSLLAESARTDDASIDTPVPFELARLVAQRGLIALENIPSVRVGKLLSVDRHETESLRSLMNLMRNYHSHDAGKKPLSIGVFGPPGSGKSFGVEQIAKQICGKEGWLEFNLSQFASTDDLIGAFHQIRDCVLRRIVPVAFFDEFDSQKLKWLQYLLAPMQDGKFQQGEMTHPIGKCIFVFAGGTSWTFDTFGPHEKTTQTAHEEFRLAKGPDFKSRLDAYLNVIGPNQKKILVPDGDHYTADKCDPQDICYPIRRALMLRGNLGCNYDTKLDMDEGILNAILHAGEFTHGSRSLAKILQPFNDGTHGPFYKSALPPLSQIGMHTDSNDFMDNCNKATITTSQLMAISGSQPLEENSTLDEAQVAILGRAFHDAYNKKTGKNYDYEPDTNLAAARRMIRNLAMVNMTIEDGTNTPRERQWIERKIEYNLELLAEAEHDGWMKWHLERGWRYAPGKEKDSGNKTHPCLLPYNDLSMEEQDKDRNSIRNYLGNLDQAESKIVLGD